MMTLLVLSYLGALAPFLSVISAISASANTLVIVLRTEDAVFVAADSKVSKGSGRDIGSACKIHVTNQFAWATAGIVNDPRSTFDTWATAETTIKAGGSFTEIVSRFDRELASQLKELLPRIKRTDPSSYDVAIKSGHPVTAIFIKNLDVRMSDFAVPNKEAPVKSKLLIKVAPATFASVTPKWLQ